MQELLEKWLVEHEWVNTWGPVIVKREFHLMSIGRRPDFLVIQKYEYGRYWENESERIINIEAKCTDFKVLLEQMKDIACLVDYSFAYIPDIAVTPRWFKAALVERGYGLIVYNVQTQCITEVLEAHQNKGRDMRARGELIQMVKASIALAKKAEIIKEHNSRQIKLEI